MFKDNNFYKGREINFDMGELYSITGLFYESFPGISPWGGFFIRGTEKGPEEIEGMLVDTYGSSLINGQMGSDSLEFRKQYQENRGQAFDYKFSLENGVWLGEYVSTQSDYNGRSICKTNLCLSDLSFRKFDMRTPDGWAKAMVDSMVEGGQLEKFRDPETGEEMIRPL